MKPNNHDHRPSKIHEFCLKEDQKWCILLDDIEKLFNKSNKSIEKYEKLLSFLEDIANKYDIELGTRMKKTFDEIDGLKKMVKDFVHTDDDNIKSLV
jgi:murein L,D-transpeptidase YafK